MKNAWSKWLVLAKKFGNVQANILLSLIYFLIIIPVGFLFKITGKFNNKKAGDPSYWVAKKKIKQDIGWARKQ